MIILKLAEIYQKEIIDSVKKARNVIDTTRTVKQMYICHSLKMTNTSFNILYMANMNYLIDKMVQKVFIHHVCSLASVSL